MKSCFNCLKMIQKQLQFFGRKMVFWPDLHPSSKYQTDTFDPDSTTIDCFFDLSPWRCLRMRILYSPRIAYGSRKSHRASSGTNITTKVSVKWVDSRRVSSSGVSTVTWFVRAISSPIRTSTSSRRASSLCGKMRSIATEANGSCGCAKDWPLDAGRISSWPCWASSSWWAMKYAGPSCPFASRWDMCQYSTTNSCMRGLTHLISDGSFF